MTHPVVGDDFLDDCPSIKAYIDAELKRRFRKNYSDAVIAEMPNILLTLFCVMMDGTHFVTARAIQDELAAMGADVPTEVIQPHLDRWRAMPLPPVLGILH
jgi:hypothetical protein